MKIKLLTPSLLLATLFFSCKKDSHPTPPPTDSSNIVNLGNGLLVYLPFNGSIADSSGHNNPTQLAGGGLTYDIHGYANSAFGGDGTGGRVIVSNNGSIQFDTAFSVSMSFMERDNSARQMLCSFINNLDAKGVTFGIGNSNPGTREMTFGVVSGLTSCGDYAEGNTANDTAYNFVPQPESWYNIVCTFRKGTLEIYINGVLSGKKVSPYSAARICPDAQLVVGGWWQGDPVSINGKIDNFRLYNRALIPAEIAMLAKNYQPNSNSIRQVVNH